MRKEIFFYLFLIAAGVVAVWALFFREQREEPLATSPPPSTTMTITSPAFFHNGAIPNKYTCDDTDIAPPLVIADVPASAKSLALIVDDPDAPRGILRPDSGQAWVHWLIWNLPTGTMALGEGSVLSAGAVEGTTDFGRTGYGGPCPPSGTHRYFFKLYALDIAMIPLTSTARKADLERAMNGHILATAELIGLYTRR